MPNHIHCIIYISDKSPELSKLIQNTKRFLAYQIVDLLKQDEKTDLLNFFQSKAEVSKGAKHKVFEDGFDSKPIYSSDFFLEKLNYIHKNPCSKKWKLAKNIEDYKYSSAMNYLSGSGVYEVDVIQPY